jgi:death-on-curing protein
MNFLTKDEVLVLHEAALAMHGGDAGLLNESMLESAVVAAVNRQGHESASLAECAATYAHHLTKSHAFVDGNKRVGLMATIAFIRLNGARLEASDDERHDLILAIAASRMTRDDVDAWCPAPWR